MPRNIKGKIIAEYKSTNKPMEFLVFPHKQIRALVIYSYLRDSDYKGIVVLSCGNASRALKEVYKYDNFDIITPKSTHWFSNEEIAKKWFGYFDATSGHLPLWLMVRIAESFRLYLGELNNKRYYVPTGSGETIICLKIAYPNKDFIAVYNLNNATKYEKYAPLNKVVSALFKIYGK